jgi:hypothetical protein
MDLDRLKKLFKQNGKPVIIVSGLPRSGTSMMMSMLTAGGLEAVVDGVRQADDNNPKGYYEFERVKKLAEGDYAWIPSAQGKVVKVISALLEHLPRGHHYKIIFMRRAMPEILASQRSMLVRNGKPTDSISDQALAELYERHLGKIEEWLVKQPNIEVLYVQYNDILREPVPELERLAAFLGNGLDRSAMRKVVDQNLYRERNFVDKNPSMK